MVRRTNIVPIKASKTNKMNGRGRIAVRRKIKDSDRARNKQRGKNALRYALSNN